MTGLRGFKTQPSRPFPIFFLIDASASMVQCGKLDVVEKSIQEMLATLRIDANPSVEYQICMITFGGTSANLIIPLQSVNSAKIPQLEGRGRTPLGKALLLLDQQLRATEFSPRTYSPVIILLSDGRPTDEWRPFLEDLETLPVFAKTQRVALAIGSDADRDMLGEFLGNCGGAFLEAADASDLVRFFRAVTVTVAAIKKCPPPSKQDKKFENYFTLGLSQEYVRTIPDCKETNYD